MTSPRQQAANLANAQKSTGPTTPEGKTASSQNNRKLGLAAGLFKVLPDECQEDFDEYATNLYLEYDPQTLTEKTLVLKMAQHYWLGQRAIRAQNMCFHYDFGPAVENESLMKQLALYIRYQAHHDRGYHKCLAELQKIQAIDLSEERKEEIHALRILKATPSPRPCTAVPLMPKPATPAAPAVPAVATEAA